MLNPEEDAKKDGVEQDSMTEEERIEQESLNRVKALKELSAEIRDCILQDILVRRTRTDIKMYYQSNLTFPEMSGPHSLEYRICAKA